jgi:methylmalonyl-CoA decarboxylase subunit alpha
MSLAETRTETTEPRVILDQAAPTESPARWSHQPARRYDPDLFSGIELKGADWEPRLTELRMLATETPSPDATRRQHDKGKLSARERIDLLVDEGSFTELQMFARHERTGFGLEANRPFTDGVVAGWGLVDGRPVAVYASDFRLFGGALGSTYAKKVHQVLDLAAKSGIPVVALNDGAGARIQEGVAALDGYGGIFRRNAALSGVVPQISVILGPCAGGAVYSPALTDFIFMVDGVSNMYITGPDVIRAVTGESVTHDELGGAWVHATRSGVAAALYPDEESCIADVRYLLSLLPANNLELPPVVAPADGGSLRARLREIVPQAPNATYDMHDVIAEIVDGGEVFEISPGHARNIICALARVEGTTVGIVANQPRHLAGALDIDASEKAARFVRFCDAFNISLVTLVDVPGFLPGTDQEHGGIIRRGAKLLYAYCEATVPRVCIILRKSYGGAYIVMDSKSIGADLVLAWPGNEVAVMGAEGAANIIFRKEIAGSSSPEATRTELVEGYRAQMMNPLVSAEQGYVDDVIDPADTRKAIVANLRLLRSKQENLPKRKHANMPL